MRLPNALKGLPDLERGLMRILHRTSHPAELAGTLQVSVHAGWLQHIHASQAKAPVELTVEGQCPGSTLLLSSQALSSTGGVLRDGMKGAVDDDLGSVSPLLQRLLHDVTSLEVRCMTRWLQIDLDELVIK